MQAMIDFFLALKPQAQTVIALALVIALGMAIGKIHVWGIGLGIGGVLFAGLAGGHLLHSIAPHGKEILNKEVLEFLREFGLILFVYTIGMQVGPGFFASLKKNGLPLNLIAASIVFLGVAVAAMVHIFGGVPIDIAVGLLSGATTNTPGLGAAQQVLVDVAKAAAAHAPVAVDTLKAHAPAVIDSLNAHTAVVADTVKHAVAAVKAADPKETSAMAYAVAYPFGIVGIIATMILIRVLFKLDPQKSAENFAKAQGKDQLKPVNLNLMITNDVAAGKRVSELAAMAGPDVVISRHLRNGVVEVADPNLILNNGDLIHAVGPRAELDELLKIAGEKSNVDLKKMDSNLVARRILVTEKAALGKTIGELDLHQQHGVTVTRVNRAGVEFPNNSELRLQYGDKVLVVGPEETVKQVGKMLGDSIHKYNHPLLIPMFIGIFLGVLLGAIPIPLGLPVPLKLGLAGGPLVMAIILSRIGRIGPMVFHVPSGPNLWVREIGIVLFLACVGIMSGGKFINTLLHGDGLYWMEMGALITAIPLLVVGFGARFFFKTNYMQLCGVLAGSMTDPPALAFANGIANSDGPAVAYATVYPLVMLLRILTAQLFVIVLSQLAG